MRSWRSSAASVAALLALGAPAAATAAPVDDFASATGELSRALRAALPRAKAAAQQRREAARRCLDVLRATPEPNREPMTEAYFLDVAFGLLSVEDRPLRRYAARLGRIHLRREPALAAARRDLRAALPAIELTGLSIDDTCTMARQWQAANWRTPPRSLRILRRFEHLGEALPDESKAAARRLRRAGHPRAAKLVAGGYGLGGDELIDTDGDPVLCALNQLTCPMSEHRQLRYAAPPGATTVLLARHGESAPVRDGEPVPLLGGASDPQLDPVGVEQAQRLAERLAGEEIAAIYVTPLRRTAETAAPLARHLGIEPHVEADLREVFLGDWEGGLFRKNVRDLHPIAVRMRDEQRWDVIPGAEPGAGFAARVRAGLERIAAAHTDETVLVVSHGGTIGQALALALGIETRPLALAWSDNGSLSEIVVGPDGWTVRRYNDTAHL